jgi:hypothetical protein
MNTGKDNTGESANRRDDDGVLEKIARAIDPPSREVSDAELIDPGANSPAPKPEHPAKTPHTDVNKPSDANRRP